MKIGLCDALHAKMWGLHLSLDMVRRDYILHLIMKNDSKLLIDMIKENCSIGGAILI